MPTEPVDSPETLDSHSPQPPDDVSESAALAVAPTDENTPDDTPEYPLSAPMKPDDPERRSEQSKAETAGLVEEQLPAHPAEPAPAKPSFKLALGSAVLIALSLGFELGRNVSQRR
jgi:hypothetical protein